MSKIFKFDRWAPSLSESTTAEEIYKLVKSMDPKNNEIVFDMTNMVAMTTICARAIFGRLYTELGIDDFNKNIKFTNISEAIIVAIKWGIMAEIKQSIQY
ncbi:MAG: STAS-like domain-containing protein [bacterium]|nr:STAS-like domain-containing protein [bacterium]